ncbi:MAG: rRNA maturation RNase YbeY [Planctomycetota bacterium]
MSRRCTIDQGAAAGVSEPALDLDRLQILVDAACARDGLDQVHLGIHWVDDAESAHLHATHFDDPTTTDVMSFPDGSRDPATGRVLLGELAVCLDVARRESTRRHVPEQDELLLYVLHGLLHLLGHDDVDPDDRREMWAIQHDVLAQIGIALDPEDADSAAEDDPHE